MTFSISAYKSNNSSAAPILFNTSSDSITVNSTTTGIIETTNIVGFTISPNPFTSQTTVSFNKEIKNATLKMVDVVGKAVRNINFSGSQLIIEKEELKAGIYFMQVVSENESFVTKKIIIQ